MTKGSIGIKARANRAMLLLARTKGAMPTSAIQNQLGREKSGLLSLLELSLSSSLGPLLVAFSVREQNKHKMKPQSMQPALIFGNH
jgi:hypothetical protein